MNSEKSARYQTAKPTYCRFKIFNPDLVGVQLRKGRVILDRPVAVGFSILELSKTLMYQFWYGVLKERYENISLCFTGKKIIFSFFMTIFIKLIYFGVVK